MSDEAQAATHFTKARAAAAGERCEAATPGPWQVDPGQTVATAAADDGMGWAICEVDSSFDGDESGEKHANFIAATRTDLPASLATNHEAMALLSHASHALGILLDDRREPTPAEYISARDRKVEIDALLDAWNATEGEDR